MFVEYMEQRYTELLMMNDFGNNLNEKYGRNKKYPTSYEV